MLPMDRSDGMTLIELLTVIAIIVVILALALPNFSTMVRSQKWSAASSALQNALMRCQTYAVNDRLDHSIEFCTEEDNASQYLRIEVESALLESIPELNAYYKDQCEFYYMRLPEDWLRTFKNGGGEVINAPAHPWGAYPNTKFGYPDPPYYNISSYWEPKTKDNLKVDDHIQLPYGITVNFAESSHLINYDKAPAGDPSAMPQYGWDYTRDLRFNMAGILVQAQNPEIVLQNKANERMRLQILRSTGRVRRLAGLN